ncbi:MAG: lysoplasmalogenase family protein [Caulobacter sp.]
MAWGAIEVALFAGSALAAVVYGLRLVGRPPSRFRTVWKTSAVALLALLVLSVMAGQFLAGQPAQAFVTLVLAAALGLCAAGDAFLADDPERGLPPGLVSFLLGHLVYIGLFVWLTPRPEAGPAALAAILAVLVVGGAMLAWLWRSLGAMRWPVTGYLAVISAMTIAAIINGAPVLILGAILFMVSDAILAGQLFRSARLFGSERLTHWAIWFLYYGAQVALTLGFIGR